MVSLTLRRINSGESSAEAAVCPNAIPLTHPVTHGLPPSFGVPFLVELTAPSKPPQPWHAATCYFISSTTQSLYHTIYIYIYTLCTSPVPSLSSHASIVPPLLSVCRSKHKVLKRTGRPRRGPTPSSPARSRRSKNAWTIAPPCLTGASSTIPKYLSYDIIYCSLC